MCDLSGIGKKSNRDSHLWSRYRNTKMTIFPVSEALFNALDNRSLKRILVFQQENCTSTQRDCLIGTLNYMAPESVCESTHETAEFDGSKKNYQVRFTINVKFS